MARRTESSVKSNGKRSDEVNVTFWIDRRIKQEFAQLAQEGESTVSHVLRRFVKEYVRRRREALVAVK